MARVFLCCLVCYSLFLFGVDAITNSDLYALLKGKDDKTEYGASDASDVITYSDDADTYLTGEADDEADIQNLIDKLRFERLSDAEISSRKDVLAKPSCSRQNNTCSYCTWKTFKIRSSSVTLRRTIHACLQIHFYPSGSDIFLIFILNRHVVCHKNVSLETPTKICNNIYGKDARATVCLSMYNINVSQKRFCTKLFGVFQAMGRKIYFRFSFACFKIPKKTGDWLIGLADVSNINDKR